MGQYYKPTSVDKMESLYSHDYGSMSKLMEHSYIGNDFVSIAQYMLTPEGDWYKNRFVWAGDYADEEPSGSNLFTLAKEIQIKFKHAENNLPNGRYIINHSTKEFIDKELVPEDEEGWKVHPLPLITCEGNGRGGGDYRKENDCIGIWARDRISIEDSVPDGFSELEPNFVMD
tara:strand:+ start:43 stop:561 length:519 start_codon:yes stop_codon:yes gene_type:complete